MKPCVKYVRHVLRAVPVKVRSNVMRYDTAASAAAENPAQSVVNPLPIS